MFDLTYITSIFNKLENNKKQCVVLIDEIYLNHSLFYHGGQLFREAENNQSVLANAALDIMFNCFRWT